MMNSVLSNHCNLQDPVEMEITDIFKMQEAGRETAIKCAKI